MYNYNDTKTYNIYQLLKDKYYIHEISGEVRWLPKQTGYYRPLSYEEYLLHCVNTHINMSKYIGGVSMTEKELVKYWKANGTAIRQGYEKLK